MSYGYRGKVLRVNLGDGGITVERPSPEFYRKYFGGWGFVGYYLLRELEPGIDPLGPENKFICALGPITGAPMGASGRNAVGAKSPLTGLFGASEMGGNWGAQLKRAGFDIIIVEGKAERPVYLWITDSQAEVRDASHLWGLTTKETQEAVRRELADARVELLMIGPGGENLVKYACVMAGTKDAAGRGGLGAVMGSKKLKAIAVRGHHRVGLADPEAVRGAAQWLVEHYQERNAGHHDLGTPGGPLSGMSLGGGLPTHNFQYGTFEGVSRIDVDTIRDTIRVGMDACYACPIRCKKMVHLTEPYQVDPDYGGPEYETLGSMGSNCDIDDLAAICKAHELSNAHGLDTISMGVCISFLMECFEQGILSQEDTGGLDICFGDGEMLVRLVEMTAHRQGYGDVIAEGVRRMAEQIGRGSDRYAVEIKGQEAPMHDPRARSPQLSLGYAVSPTGCEHMHAHIRGVMRNVQCLCQLVGLPDEQIQRAINGATGWDTTPDEWMVAAKRALDMGRAFNALKGATAADDVTAPRFTEAFEFGPRKGAHIDLHDLEQMKRDFYREMGYEPVSGCPTAETLKRRGLSWVAKKLAQYGKLPG